MIEKLQEENDRLREKENRNTAFWAQLSREIRTSLSAIVGISGEMKTNLDKTEELEDQIKEIEEHSESLFELANCIVDYSYLTRESLELKPVVFDVKDLFEEVMDYLTPLAKRSKVHLFTNHYDVEHIRVDTDWDRLKQILSCYGVYAIGHTPSEGNVLFTLKQETTEQGKVRLRFNLKTTGQNMYQSIVKDYEYLQKQMLRANKYDGRGIELYVSSCLIDLLKGAVTYKSDNEFESQLGLAFEFEESLTEQVKHKQSYIFENERILLIEKDKEWCQFYREYLLDIGIEYDVATDEEQALDMLGEAEDQEKPYSICLMKWNSEDICVEELVTDIRQIFSEDVVLLAVAKDEIEGVEPNKIEGLNYLVEKSWVRSMIFDIIVKMKKGALIRQEELALEQNQYDFENRRILLAEDIMLNAEIVVKMLNKVNVSVTEAVNGLEAVSIFNRKPEGYFNCILMDINMPVMDGYTATAEIRNSGKSDAKTVPIYAMTANALADDIQQALDAGMDGHIAKPVEPAKLYALLEKIFDTIENDQFMDLKQKADELKQKNEDLQNKAEHDHLTGLLNRHGYERKIEEYREQKAPIGLMLIDLDKFKGINDTFGHQIGDRVLQKLAITLKKHFRPTDDVIRFGGDEFSVILTNINTEQEFVLKIVEDINEELQNPSDGLPPFSISTGVAFSEEGYSEELYNKADQALYVVKENGRCGCKIYSEDEQVEKKQQKETDMPNSVSNLMGMIDLYQDKAVLLHDGENWLKKLLERNNALGVICGFYSENYPIYAISTYTLQTLGYTYDEFMSTCKGQFEKLIYIHDILTLYEAEETGRLVTGKIRLVSKTGKPILFYLALVNVFTKDGRKMWYSSFREIDETIVDEMCEMNYDVVGVIDPQEERIIFRKGIENLKELRVKEGAKYDYDAMLRLTIAKHIVESEQDNVYRKASLDYVVKKLDYQPSYQFTARRTTENGSAVSVRYRFRYLNTHRDGIICTQEIIERAFEDSLRLLEKSKDDVLCMAEVNLTQNMFSNVQATGIIKQCGNHARTLDEFLRLTARPVFDLEEQKKYRELFNREALLERFEQGESHVAFEHFYRVDEASTAVVETVFDMLRDSESGDVIGICYAKDRNETILSGLLLNAALDKDYMRAALVYADTEEYYLYELDQEEYCAHKQNYWDGVCERLNDSVDAKEMENIHNNLNGERVVHSLENSDEYLYAFYGTHRGKRCRLEAKYCYADRQHHLLLGSLRNITDDELYEQYKYESEHDPLTQLYNRKTVFAKCRELLTAHPEDQFVMAHIDMKHFRLFNTFFGDEAGDQLICNIADMFRALSADYDYWAYGRIESDVFCAFFPYDEKKYNKHVTEILKYLKGYRSDFLIEPKIGLFMVTDPEMSVEAMFTRATLAAEEVRSNTWNATVVYDEKLEVEMNAQQRIINEMQTAIEQEQFEVYLQPKYSLRSERLVGAEALVRWNHPEQGMISPGLFIPIFEKNGFIAELDKYMWEHVCQILRKWENEGKPMYPVSVNISRISMYSQTTVPFLKSLIEKYDLDPKYLELELTESAYMDDPEDLMRMLKELQAYGFKILLDDFGSGYSCLNTLRELPVDVLKLDMKFLSMSQDDIRGNAVLFSVVRMSKLLRLPIVAEGVETQEQAEFLRGIGCEYVQGYLYARPMPVADYEDMLVEKKEQVVRDDTSALVHIGRILAETGSDTYSMGSVIPAPLACVEYVNQEVTFLRVNTEFITEFGMAEETETASFVFKKRLPKESYSTFLQGLEKSIQTGEKTQVLLCWNNDDSTQNRYICRISYEGDIGEMAALVLVFVNISEREPL